MAVNAKLVKELRDKTGAGMMDCKKALDATNGDIEAAFDWLREKGIAKAEKKAGRTAAEGLSAFYIDGNTAAVVEVNSETDFVAQNQEFKDLVADIAKIVCEKKPADVDAALKLDVNGQDLNTLIKEKSGKIGEHLLLRRLAVVEKNDDEVFGAYSHMGGSVTALVKIAGADADKARDVAMHVAAQAPKYITEDDIPEEARERELNVLKTQALEENAKAAKPKPEKIIEKIISGRLKKNFKEVCLVDQEFVKDPDQTVGQFLGKGKVEEMVRFKVGEGIEKKEENFAEEVAQQMAAANK